MEAPLLMLMGEFWIRDLYSRTLAAMIPRVVKNGCFTGINTTGGVEGYFLFFWRETTGGKWRVGTGTLAACTRGGRWADGKPILKSFCVCVWA